PESMTTLPSSRTGTRLSSEAVPFSRLSSAKDRISLITGVKSERIPSQRPTRSSRLPVSILILPALIGTGHLPVFTVFGHLVHSRVALLFCPITTDGFLRMDTVTACFTADTVTGYGADCAAGLPTNSA